MSIGTSRARCKFYGCCLGTMLVQSVAEMAASKPNLAKTLSRLREQSGLSVRELEDVSGVARSVISRLERGEYLQPTPSTLNRLASALGIDASQLLTAAGYTTNQADALPSIRPYLRNKYGHLSGDERQQLAEFVEKLEAGRRAKRATKKN
jgi:transcriptional regulator with XRE-family HTH domain